VRIIRAKDYEEMSRRTASIIAAQIVAKPASVLGFATGTTPIGAYRQLVKWCADDDISFKDVKTVNLDEYAGIPGTHDQSYRYFMFDNLFSHVDIDEKNVNLPDGMAEDYVVEGVRYDVLIDSLGGVDLQLLGIGRNGHIGFNEPCDYFPLGTHSVELTQSTIEANSRLFSDISEVPLVAITMGIANIMAARKIVIAINGKNKAEILKEAFFGPVTPKVPASILQLHPDVVLVADEDALSAL